MAPLYSRYVPPKKPAESVQPISIPSNGHTDVPATTSAEPAQGKKRKRKDVENTKSDSSPIASKKQPSPLEQAEEKVAKTSKKIKKTKEEKRKTHAKKEKGDATEEDVDMDDAEEDGSIPKKHTGVLSKYQKATQRQPVIDANETTEDQGPAPILHDLIPLPQPPRAATPEYLPTFSALPPWLSRPTIVSPSTTKPFSELNLSTKTLSHLEAKGYSNAFAVQSALLPLLLPHPYLTRVPPNDVCVSAPTGSGKTLGYVLPIVDSLRNKVETKLRAVIVVPTRELVAQAYSVASLCATGSGLQIAVAVGNQSLAAEQENLIRKGRKYDPEGYERLMAKAKRRIDFDQDSDDEAEDLEDTSAQNTMLDDVVQILPNHVPTYDSAIDILICTPGRLVEHMSSTFGFNLDDVEWLVIDEADRLLDQSFQEWVSKVVGALEVKKPEPEWLRLQEPTLRSLLRPQDRYVRKVILSATMTRDIAKLSALKLRRPTMIVVKSETETPLDGDVTMGGVDTATSFELPRTLSEYAIPVGDGSDKPLYLLELLQSRILNKVPNVKDAGVKTSSTNDDDDSTSSEDDSDSDSSDSSSDDDGSSSDSDSDSHSDSDESASSSDSDSSSAASTSSPSSLPTTQPGSDSTSSSGQPQILVFTSSTEAASRLHHLLSHLSPSYKPFLTLLTKTSTPTSLLTPTTSPRIIISTDRASRGLDLPALTHVINYSLPRSVASYVHRVGRTARAGRSGAAWTLFAENEGRWFWRDIARSDEVGRKWEVGRVNMKLSAAAREGGEMRKAYEGVLEGMKEIVGKSKGKKG